jgi:DNA-binding LacI/PurR family transcriptional regulator
MHVINKAQAGVKMKKVTIRDVAKTAGVSYVTVSNVINSTGRMSEKTRKKVLDVIKKIDFHPDGSARVLARGKSDAIAFVSSYLSSPFVIGVLSGVERRLFESGKFKHSLEHHSTRGARDVKSNLLKNILYGKKADAVIMLTIKPENKLIKEFRKRGIPMVLIENKAAGAHSVLIDNYRGAYSAVDYLIKKGRKKITIVSGPAGASAYDEEENPAVHERMKGYIDALKDNGLPFETNRSQNVIFFNQEEGVRIIEKIKKDAPDTDAIFCAAGDITAMGIIYRAKNLGIRIPQDISLVGYDDISVAAIMNPAMTTVRQPLDEMGKRAFDLAIGSLEGKIKGAQEILLAPELIIRESA